MAEAYESNQSRDGDTAGVDRLESTIVMVSSIDAVGDDPITVVESRHFPLNQRHPIDRFSQLVVQRYVQRRTTNPLVWFVDVIFDLPDRAGFAGWLTEITYGEQTVKKFVDLDGRIVGADVFRVSEVQDGTSPFWVYSPHAPDGRIDLHLVDSETREKTREGMDIFEGASTLVLHRTLRNVTATIMRSLQRFHHTMNDERFLAWAPYELLFRHATIREEAEPTGEIVDGRSEPGPSFVYPTELHFGVKFTSDDEPEGWRKIRKIQTFGESDGRESVIFELGSYQGGIAEIPVSRLYRRYDAKPFHDILALIEGGSPRRVKPSTLRRPA